MLNPSSLFHHAKRRRLLSGKPLVNTKTARLVDFFAYPIGILGLVSTIPQAYQIWILHETGGVSLVTWASWTVMSTFWIFYAKVHKAHAMVFIQTLGFRVNASIAIGILVNS